MPAGPIFIVGTMRSGSTLFRLVLDAHPNIAIGEETGFMGALAATRQVPNWQHGRDWFVRLGWTEPEFDARLREFYAGLFERHAAAQGKGRWGDKTPFHSAHIGQMATLFPDAVFVGIVRHPGAVVHSLVRRFHYPVAEAAAYWASTNQEILRHGVALGDDRFALVRYEDLVLHPETTLRELTSWLGEPWSDDLLRHNDIQAGRDAPRIAAGNTRTRDPIRTELADRWAGALATADREVLVSQAGALAGFLGYDPARPGEPARIVPENGFGRSRLLSGGAVAQRLRDHPAVAFDASSEAVIMPEMSAAELAKRLQHAERSLARLRSRRTVRWANAVRRAQRRVTGVPAELVSLAIRAADRRGTERRDP